jgi:N6-L-threonylcarbamoyladenine synthase
MSVVVAFDTSTDATALCIGQRSGDEVSVMLERDFEARRASLSRLLPELQEALARAQLVPEDIDEVVCGLGPGSFTGVRIGVAMAKGLSHALGVPLYGVGTLDTIAWRSCGAAPVIGVLGDAMRGEVYPMLFDSDGTEVHRRRDEYVAEPADVAKDWAETLDSPLLLTGNGLVKYADLFASELDQRASIAAEYLWEPSGRAMLAAYSAARRRGHVGDGDVAAVLPIYTRLSDAEEAVRGTDGGDSD